MSIPLASLKKQCDLEAMSEGQNTVAMAQMAPRSGHHNANAQSQSYHILESLWQSCSRPDVLMDSFSMDMRVVILSHIHRPDLHMKADML